MLKSLTGRIVFDFALLYQAVMLMFGTSTCPLWNLDGCRGNCELLFPSFDPVVLLPPGSRVWIPEHPPVEQCFGKSVVKTNENYWLSHVNTKCRKHTYTDIILKIESANYLFIDNVGEEKRWQFLLWMTCKCWSTLHCLDAWYRFALLILFCVFSPVVFLREF